MMQSPKDLEWIEGDLPDVHTVPYDCCVLVWTAFHNAQKVILSPNPENKEFLRKAYTAVSAPELEGKFKSIRMVRPWKDDLNPLRWDDSVGYQETVKYYAWLDKGTV